MAITKQPVKKRQHYGTAKKALKTEPEKTDFQQHHEAAKEYLEFGKRLGKGSVHPYDLMPKIIVWDTARQQQIAVPLDDQDIKGILRGLLKENRTENDGPIPPIIDPPRGLVKPSIEMEGVLHRRITSYLEGTGWRRTQYDKLCMIYSRLQGNKIEPIPDMPLLNKDNKLESLDTLNEYSFNLNKAMDELIARLDEAI